MKISAVIVTYNRLEKLQNCLNGIIRLTVPLDFIYVVDNNSIDGTREWIRQIQKSQDNIKSYFSSANVGGAGGFKIGMQLAYEDGADLIWIMDDDCCPSLASLEHLVNTYMALKKNIRPPSFLCSKVLWRDGSLCKMNIPQFSSGSVADHQNTNKISKINSCSFVSCMVPRTSIKECGLPYEDFFIWYDDIEYTSRLNCIGDGYLVHDSIVLHDCESNSQFTFQHINENNAWKYYYGARNESWYRWNVSKQYLNWLKYILFRLIEINRANTTINVKLRIIKALLTGIAFHPRK